jgi:hypothetical protein
MAFVAGSIVGNLLLNTSGFTGAIAGAVSAATSAGPGIAGPILAGLNLIEETAVKVFHLISDTIKSVGKDFDDLGEAAERAGVGVSFLSGVGFAAKDAGSSVEGLGDAMKFLNRNTQEAIDGSQQTVAAFGQLGISVEELRSASPEELFYRVADGIKGIESPAQKTRVAMELLGRGGTEMLPLLNQGSEGIRAMQADIEDLGAVTTKEQAKWGDDWGRITTLIDAAWTGVRNTFAAPFLEFVSEHFDEIKRAVIDVSKVIREALPLAMQAAYQAVTLALPAFEALLETLGEIGDVTDSLGLTNALGPTSRQAAQSVGDIRRDLPDLKAKIDVLIDPRESSGQIAGKILPAIQQAQGEYVDHQTSLMHRQLVAANVGGRAR